jgi:Arc/MetJ-type ribon-helix-helix transcriptional regulator
MLGDEELSEAVELGAYKEQSDYWDAALGAHSQRADQKGKTLRRAQGFLAAGVCVLAFAILMILMGSFL